MAQPPRVNYLPLQKPPSTACENLLPLALLRSFMATSWIGHQLGLLSVVGAYAGSEAFLGFRGCNHNLDDFDLAQYVVNIISSGVGLDEIGSMVLGMPMVRILPLMGRLAQGGIIDTEITGQRIDRGRFWLREALTGEMDFVE